MHHPDFKFLLIPALVATILSSSLSAQWKEPGRSYFFDRHYGQVEVGGRYAGAEFHRSRPVPSRISMYYPVANSIDLSTDYWRRDESLPLAVGLQIGGGDRRWIGREGWSYVLSPHRVRFEKEESPFRFAFSYEFCLNEPAMVITLEMKNVSPQPVDVTTYSHLKLTLRTCQTYARKDSARTSFEEGKQMIAAQFDDSDAAQPAIFVLNGGERAESWTADCTALSISDSGTSDWIHSTGPLRGITHESEKGLPAAAFEYRKIISPGDSLEIVLIVGSCRQPELKMLSARLYTKWRTEVASYDELVRLKSEQESVIRTGNPVLDASAIWAKSILTANAHYIDGKVVPMPCPAEYNFFFAHDVLMTDLAAVNFDLPRVKNDLLYVSSHADGNIIPHAYYWRDNGFKTEYCTPDNWNHFWFVLLTGSYLRHSLDDSIGNQLYSLVSKSVSEILTGVKPDHLSYAFRPDWWDMGHIEGPRTYTTTLAIRALREYLFISSFLRKSSPKLAEYEALADSMQGALASRLWDAQSNYLMNYNGGKLDEHFYMGSLVPAALGFLERDKAQELVRTAARQLLDANIGIRNAMPPDFNSKESIELYKFAGEEAGKPYVYANGGVWPHCNAWYALALKSIGNADDAVDFVKNTMTIDGVVSSPMGQPAMYEYRFADPSSSEYGRIDKPNFLWAGGFYLKTLYDIFGLNEDEWNISFGGPLPSGMKTVTYNLMFGVVKSVEFRTEQIDPSSLTIDGAGIPSTVLPTGSSRSTRIRVNFGPPRSAVLKSVNALVENVRAMGAEDLECVVRSFSGHHTVALIQAPREIKEARVNDSQVDAVFKGADSGGSWYEIHFKGSAEPQRLQIFLKGAR